MPDDVTREKWDRAAPGYDLMSAKGTEKRWAPWKQDLFSNMDGHILFLALGTGLDIAACPPNRDITAIDISPKMIEQAHNRVNAYQGEIKVHEMDLHELTFDEAEFDQVFSSCTFCSVPDPIAGLQSLKRVMKPGGELYMFEHTGSRYFPFNLMMEIMTPISRKFGTEMKRNTVYNVKAAGFTVTEVNHIFLDIVKTIKATS